MTIKAINFFNLQIKPIFRTCTFAFVMTSIMIACSTVPEREDIVVFDKIKVSSPYKLAIVNSTSGTINDIKYKPCNSHAAHYQYIAGNLRPSEKFTINIYSQCVDLIATDAFKKKLVDLKNVDLKSRKTWNITYQ